MHFNTKNMLQMGVSVVGVAVAVFVGSLYWDFLETELPPKSVTNKGASTPLKPLEKVVMPERYAGPPFVPVGVFATSVYTSEFGPYTELRFSELDVERCPPSKTIDDRFSQSTSPSTDIRLRAEGAWCFEAKPGQKLQPKVLHGDLLDYRSDAFLMNDSKVEYVDVQLANGEVRSVFAGAVSVCDNDGLCAASVVVDRTHPSPSMGFRLPMVNRGDVVRYGSRSSSGVIDQSEAVYVDSFIKLQRLHKSELLPKPEVQKRVSTGYFALDDNAEDVDIEFGATMEPEPEPEPQPRPEPEHLDEAVPVYDDDSIEVNTVQDFEEYL